MTGGVIGWWGGGVEEVLSCPARLSARSYQFDEAQTEEQQQQNVGAPCPIIETFVRQNANHRAQGVGLSDIHTTRDTHCTWLLLHRDK